jgi:3-isopropylmalate/(R)-2-methylmalate dehydratase small subunit
MEPFTILTGRAAPLLAPNINTDVVIRIERLTNEPRAELGRFAFEALRYRADGSEETGFVLNQPAFRGAPILLAGRNFGCGSSREGAVWALMGLGLRCVVAESFGDIFYNNCFQNGMLPVTLPRQDVDLLAQAAARGASLTVDLVQEIILAPGAPRIRFAVDPQRREGLLEGLDEIGRTMKFSTAIEAWEHADRARRPWVWEVA